MNVKKSTVTELIHHLFSLAGVTVGGNNPWDIQIHDDLFYKKILNNADLELGEMYMDGLWDCSAIDQLIYRLMLVKIDKKVLNYPQFWRSLVKQFVYTNLQKWINFQSVERSKIVGQQHYDISIELYSRMLDKRMVYTCAYWDGANNLDEAQENKLKLACQKLNLRSGMTLLDIGCGWGSFAKYAAENYQVSVVGITISEEQQKLAKKICASLPIEIRLQDYRDLLKSPQQFDRIVSLGMFEHVGQNNYLTYMKAVEHSLKDDGLFLLHTIGSNCSKNPMSPWINKYIFPNGQIPTIGQISHSMEDIFVMEDWQNLGVHYDKTLMAWYHNFVSHWDEIKPKYDEKFYRMWSYYLLSCAGCFRARYNQLWQIVLTKNGLPNGFSRMTNSL